MKMQTTRKFIANNYDCKFCGYADLSYLFTFYSAAYYTCGVYGWNFDAYIFGGKCITTGYSGMIGERIDDKIVQKYNNKAREILNDTKLVGYEMKKCKLDKLIEEFFEEVF